MSDLTVANTILAQLGGKRFIAFTGSKNFVGDDNSLTMKLARNKSGANILKITLTWKDLYDMEFKKNRGSYFDKNFVWHEPETKIVKVYRDVFFDQLQELFTEVTGLCTHF